METPCSHRKYADAIGADRYAKDAMETVRYAEAIDRGLSVKMKR